MVNQERLRWVQLLGRIVMLLNGFTIIRPTQKAQLFDLIYSVFPLHVHRGIVKQYYGSEVNDMDLMPHVV